MFPEGTTATLLCSLGYPSSGASRAVCQNGTWTPTTLGQCSVAQTAQPQCTTAASPVLNGAIRYSNGQPFGPWPVGSSASLSCNFGLIPSGPTVSTCSGNGQWLPAVLGPCPSSRSTGTKQCPVNPARQGGTITYSSPEPYSQGTTATLTCTLGFTVSGSSYATCLAGTWNPDLGKCLLGSLQHRPISPIVAQQNAVEIEELCAAPLASPYGEITFSKPSNMSGFAPGTTAALRCTFGRWITGPSFATCSHGVFRPMLGKCTDGRESTLPGVCLPLTPPTNGRILFSFPFSSDIACYGHSRSDHLHPSWTAR